MQAVFRFPFHKLTCAAVAFVGSSLICSPAARAQTNPPNSTLITYFNFNDGNAGTGFTSDAPGARLTDTASVTRLTPSYIAPSNAGNVATGDPVPSGAANNLYLHLLAGTNGSKSFQFTTSTAGLSDLALSFAIQGSGFTNFSVTSSATGATVLGSGSITNSFVTQTLDLKSFTGVDNQNSITFTIAFTPNNPAAGSFVDLDNIQLTKKPEPATTAAGALTVLGLCWHQRRRFTSLRKLFGSARARAT